MPCDDGNTISLDGCSSTCEIEDGFVCSHNTGAVGDTCALEPPEFLAINMTDYNNVLIEFTKDVAMKEPLTEEDIYL